VLLMVGVEFNISKPKIPDASAFISGDY